MGGEVIMKIKLENLIFNLEFSKAKSIVDTFDENELKDLILDLGFERKSVLLYTFMTYLVRENESSALHYTTSLLMSHPLCHIDDAYQAGLYHARKAISLDENNVELYEYILFFNTLPDVLLSYQEAENIKLKIDELKRKNY